MMILAVGLAKEEITRVAVKVSRSSRVESVSRRTEEQRVVTCKRTSALNWAETILVTNDVTPDKNP